MPKEPKEEKVSLFKRKRVKQLLIIAFILFNIGIIGWTASRELNRDEGLPEAHFTWWLLLLAVVAFVGAVFVENNSTGIHCAAHIKFPAANDCPVRFFQFSNRAR